MAWLRAMVRGPWYGRTLVRFVDGKASSEEQFEVMLRPSKTQNADRKRSYTFIP